MNAKAGGLDRSILFVLGAARSGTTFLADILFEWFDYGMGPEGTFVKHFYDRLWRYRNLEREPNLRRLIQDVSRCEMLHIARQVYPPRRRFDVTPELIRQHLPWQSYAGVVYSVFSGVARLQNKANIGNKNPSYWRSLDMLLKLFPEQSKYLCLVRDGRDVALSLERMSWGENTAYASAGSWVRCVSEIERLRRSLSPERVAIMSYESFLREPRSAVVQLESFLDHRLSSEQRQKLVTSIENSPMRENSGKWRHQMSGREIERFEAIAGDALKRHGYETVFDRPKLGYAERVWFSLEEQGRRARLTWRSLKG